MRFFLWLCLAMSHKINVHMLSLFVHAWLRFYSSMQLPSVIFQVQTVELTPSDIMCSWWLSEAAIINNISTFHCNIRHLVLFRSQVSILTWLLKVVLHLDSTSHISHHALQSAFCLALHWQLRGLWRAQTLLSISCQLIWVIKENKVPYLLLLYYIYLFNKLLYCCSITVVCIFSPPLPPTPAKLTFLPCFHPPLWFCPYVLYSSSWKPFSLLSPPPPLWLSLDCSLNIFIDYAITVVPFPPHTPLHPAHPLPPTFPPIVHVHGSYL